MDASEKARIDLEREHIVEKVKGWLRQAQTPIEEVVNPNVSPSDVVLKVTGKKVPGQPQAELFVIFPNDIDFLSISSYVHFKKSDNTGFKLLRQPDKVKFVNMLRIPLLTLNLSYTWIPSLENFESLNIFKQIFFDGFNKNSYYDAASAVMHGYEVALGKYEEFRDSVSRDLG